MMKHPGGRPKGIPREGNYGKGIQTETMRVPAGQQERIRRLLQEMPQLLEKWESKCATSSSPRYERAKELLEELKSLWLKDEGTT